MDFAGLTCAVAGGKHIQPVGNREFKMAAFDGFR